MNEKYTPYSRLPSAAGERIDAAITSPEGKDMRAARRQR